MPCRQRWFPVGSRLSQRFLAVDLRPATSYRQCMGRMSRSEFFCGKVARIGYAAASVWLLTVAQSTAIQDVPEWMDANRAPVASGAEQRELFRWDGNPREVLRRKSASSGNGSLSRDKFTDSLEMRRVVEWRRAKSCQTNMNPNKRRRRR
jgi:hypothetical protein